MFEKLKKGGEPKEPVIQPELKKELLEEIRKSNYREMIITGIKLRAAERSKILYPDKYGQIEQFMSQLRTLKKDLSIGCEIIEDELVKINKK